MKTKLKTIKIDSAKYVEDYKLQLFFSDGNEQIVNFGPFLKSSYHPEIRKFLILKNFKQFSIKSGDLMWGDFDLLFPIMDLYQNNLKQVDEIINNSKSQTP